MARAEVPPDPMPRPISNQIGLRPVPTPQRTGGWAFYGDVTIRWESAAPLRAAEGRALSPEFAQHYVITITGLPLDTLETVLPQGVVPFLGTQLKFSGQRPIPMEYVFLSRDKKTLGLAFPRKSSSLPANTTKAEFRMLCRGLTLKSTFDLKTMIWRGKLAL
jgi:hypothetical protein